MLNKIRLSAGLEVCSGCTELRLKVEAGKKIVEEQNFPLTPSLRLLHMLKNKQPPTLQQRDLECAIGKPTKPLKEVPLEIFYRHSSPQQESLCWKETSLTNK